MSTTRISNLVAMEDRELRDVARMCIEEEMRVKLLSELVRRDVGLKEVEEFVKKERGKLRVGGKIGASLRKHREIVRKIMKEKLRDSKGTSVKLRRDKKVCMRNLELRLGKGSREFERLKREVKDQVNKIKLKLKERNEKKVKFLEDKYRGVRNEALFGLRDDEAIKYGQCKIFNDEELGKTVIEDEVVIVSGVNKLKVDDDEKNMCKLGPKFCVIGSMSEERCEVAIEECIAKLKWDKMGEEIKERGMDPAMKAIEEVLDQEHLDDLEEHEQRLDGEASSVFLMKEGKAVWQYSKKRVTSMKGNTSVILPTKVNSFKEEAAFETMRVELMEVFRRHIRP